ncbi:Gfo/Idh/MocA family oxidoreductase [Paenibacillus filicis]|uniref:Gfo/Idh/MocA family oxidoreductase n=1 Tax=Paenibacillus gyeongsangnamensis TaxID=3388067 RepID=A0ABT4QKW3_9BACL|nr:Gfo/Idh/MocA family oxidoreductase [Paenibacillus filicis]MCZ8517360.1 Gfo/Idh/MocA family oxidoreductase [Paenibacillus filicis]
MNAQQFSVIGCQHAHIGIFISEMLALGYTCAGIYEEENHRLARGFSDKFGIPLAANKESLLGDTVAVVGCASINEDKIEVIELCESRGKHVMLDKPAVTSRRGLERLQDLIGRGRIQIGMLLTERFHPAIYTLKQTIDQGVLGELVSIGMRKPHRLDVPMRPSWFFSKRQSGGILIDLLVHDFDLLRWLTGKEIVKLEGMVGKTVLPEYPTFYNTASLQVLMEGGIATQLYADWHTPDRSWTWGDGRIFVTGTEGFVELRLSGDPLIREDALMIQITHQEPVASAKLMQPPRTITEDFIRRIQGYESILTHGDLLKTTEATIDADEQVHYFTHLEGKVQS